jgi:hypothetical protein
MADAALMDALQVASEAKHKQRWARAAELFERAAARAAAASSPPDSLVVLDIRLRRALTLLDQARAAPADAPALCADVWATVSAAAATLTARADAATLLPGALRADELAYSRAAVHVELHVEQAHKAADERYVKLLQSDAPLLGYDCVCRAALVVLARLLPGQMELPPLQGAAAAAAHAFMLRALALVREVTQSHSFGLVLGPEVRLVNLLVQVCAPERAPQIRGLTLDASFYDALLLSWRRADTQAALEERCVFRALAAGGEVEKDLCAGAARRAADAAAKGVRVCALPACGVRAASVCQFKLCGGCKRVAYCSAEHAAAHWKSGHKQACSRSAQQQA